jgi:hypothetical protein
MVSIKLWVGRFGVLYAPCHRFALAATDFFGYRTKVSLNAANHHGSTSPHLRRHPLEGVGNIVTAGRVWSTPHTPG